MTLDAVGDVLKVEAAEGDGVEDGIRIENRSAAALPEDPERNVITPALRAFMAVYGAPLSVKVTVEHKITPGRVERRIVGSGRLRVERAFGPSIQR